MMRDTTKLCVSKLLCKNCNFTSTSMCIKLRYAGVICLVFHVLRYNIIHIRKSIMWDGQYFMECED